MGFYLGGGAYRNAIWNEVSISTCGGLIQEGGPYIRMFTVLFHYVYKYPLDYFLSTRPFNYYSIE